MVLVVLVDAFHDTTMLSPPTTTVGTIIFAGASGGTLLITVADALVAHALSRSKPFTARTRYMTLVAAPNVRVSVVDVPGP